MDWESQRIEQGIDRRQSGCAVRGVGTSEELPADIAQAPSPECVRRRVCVVSMWTLLAITVLYAFLILFQAFKQCEDHLSEVNRAVLSARD